MNPRLAIAIILGATLGVLGLWASTPNTGPEPSSTVRPARVSAARPEAAPRVLDEPAQAPSAAPDGFTPPTERASPAPEPVARTVDPPLPAAAINVNGVLPITPEAIDALYASNEQPLEMCERWFPAGGRHDVDIELVIGRTGEGPAYVRSAHVPDDPDSPLGPCIATALRDAVFKAPKGVEDVSLDWKMPKRNR